MTGTARARSPQRPPRRASEPPAITVVGPVARAARRARRGSSARPLHGAGRGGHAGARAGQRPGGAAGRAGRRGGGGARDPDRAALGDGEVAAAVDARRDYALVCLTSPNGARLLLRGAGRGGPRRPRPGRRDGGGDRPGHRRRARARTGSAPTWCPSARSRRRSSRRSRTCRWRDERVLVARAAEARDVLPEALARARAPRSTSSRSTTPSRSRSATSARAARARRLRDLHLVLHRPLLRGDRRPACPAGARVVSIGPVTSATARELGLEVHVEAERHDIDGLVAKGLSGLQIDHKLEASWPLNGLLRCIGALKDLARQRPRLAKEPRSDQGRRREVHPCARTPETA